VLGTVFDGCLRCPKCGSGDVRESYTRTLRDALLEIFGLVAHRCRACRSRFYGRSQEEYSEEDIEEHISP